MTAPTQPSHVVPRFHSDTKAVSRMEDVAVGVDGLRFLILMIFKSKLQLPRLSRVIRGAFRTYRVAGWAHLDHHAGHRRYLFLKNCWMEKRSPKPSCFFLSIFGLF